MDITFAIPTYNSGKTIMAVLESLGQQDFLPKVLVMDNGSIDGTFEMLEAAKFNGWFRGIDLRIEKITRLQGGPKKNIPYARYKLCQAVESEYVFLLDSDVVLSPHSVEQVYQTLLADKKNAVVGVRVDPIVDHVQFGASVMRSSLAKQIKWQNTDKCECLNAIDDIAKIDPELKVIQHPTLQARHLKLL